LSMNFRVILTVSPALAAGALLAGCALVKHVPPGQSLSSAMAKRPEVVAMPAPPAPPAPSPDVETDSDAGAAVRPVATQLPLPQTESVADAFTLGNLCLQQSRWSDAITAYQVAVKGDPSFAEAWNNLAIAYQNSGQEDKAMAAFRKSKMVAQH
jgi:tetratricopeptide (TPR) repeat protein